MRRVGPTRPKIGKSSLVLELTRSWNGDVIGPIDFHGIEDRDDFYDTLAAGLGLDASDWRTSVRPELRRRRALLLHRYESLFDPRHDWRVDWERDWERLR